LHLFTTKAIKEGDKVPTTIITTSDLFMNKSDVVMIVNYSGKTEKNQPKLALHSPQDSKTPSIIVLFDEDIQPTHLYSQEEQKDIINT